MKKIVLLVFLSCAIATASHSQTIPADTLGLDKAGAVGPEDLISGRISGVHVSATDGNPLGVRNTLIRGLNTIRGNSNPLFVVDGVQMLSGINENIDAFSVYGEASYVTGIGQLLGLSAYDIESIEVIKDLSATALYGVRGANGVISIKTRLDRTREKAITWNSNLGVDTKGAFSHNHNFSFSGGELNSAYNISAFYRNTNGSVSGTGGDYLGLKVNFDTKTNKTVWFGVNARVSMGKASFPLSTNWFGKASQTVGSGFDKSGYDDNSEDYSATASSYLTINFLPGFYWKTEGGIDFRSLSRIFWYGFGTDFGASYGGVSAMLSTMMLGYNVKSSLNFERYFAYYHQVRASAGVEAIGDFAKYNTMSGDTFLDESLRGKGLSLMNSEKIIRKYDKAYSNLNIPLSLAYNFKEIAGVDLSASLTKTAKYDNEFSFLPAARVYFDLGNLLLAEKNGTISSLRLTGGYGRAAYERAVPYYYIGSYCAASSYPEIETAGLVYHDAVIQLRSSEWTAGLHAGLFSDRLTIDAKYFDKSTTDAFSLWCFGTKGEKYWYSSQKTLSFEGSRAKILNNGVEIDLAARLLEGKRVRWTVGANLTWAANRITECGEDVFYGSSVGSGVIANVNVAGYGVSSLYGYKMDSDGAPVDYNRDGRITAADKQVLGCTIPKIYGALFTTLKAGDFTFDAVLTGACGQKVLDMNRMLTDGISDVCEKYVRNNDYLRLQRVSVSYSLPVKARWLRDITLILSSRCSGYPDTNCFGINSLSYGIDYGSFPLTRDFLLGLNVKF